MTLAAKLDEIRSHYDQMVPAESMALMHRAIDELKQNGAADKILGVGKRLPLFELNNQFGETLKSDELLEYGPLVFTVYRGFW